MSIVKNRGFSLIELMIAMVIGLIVVLTMGKLMSSTLGTTTRTVQMAMLTQQLRSAMQMISRDVRRTSYSSDAILCYANFDCATDGSLNLPDDIGFNTDLDCFTFLHDRNHDGNATNDAPGAFRLNRSGTIGAIEIWIGTTAPDCTSTSTSWEPVTDPDIVDVYFFRVDDLLSHTDIIDQDAGGDVLQKIRKVRIQIRGRLIFDPQVVRILEDTTRVRNNIVL